MITLSTVDLLIAAGMVMLLASFNFSRQRQLSTQIVIAMLRAAVQLVLIGLVLRSLFSTVNPWIMMLVVTVMLLMAGKEAVARQKRPLKTQWSFGIGSSVMFVSSFSLAIFTLLVMLKPDPWYSPQYAIPLLGMLLGNTMNGISISVDRLTETSWQMRHVIEQRLMLGQSAGKAITDIKNDSLRAGLIPIINAMTTAGVVSLPGMMTGQILAGSAPMDAVKYQILILFLITVGTGFGVHLALWLTSRKLFDHRDRLRLDRLKSV